MKITDWLDHARGHPARKVEPPTLTCGCPVQVSAHYGCVECGHTRCPQHRLDPHQCETPTNTSIAVAPKRKEHRMSGLATRLAEALDRAEQQARSIDVDTGWYGPGDLSRAHREGGAGLPAFDETHIVAWSPARVLQLIERDRAALRAHVSAGEMLADHVDACGPDLCSHRDYLAAAHARQWTAVAVDAAARFWLTEQEYADAR